MAPGWRWLRRAAVLLIVLAASLTGGVASAHPFGDPQTAEISGDGDTVRVRWRAAPDDFTMLAIELQLVDSRRTFVYKDGALVPEESDATDIEALVGAPEFTDYLLQHVQVRSGGQECAGSVESLDGLADDGAELSFACSGPVTAADVSISTLTDLHEAYRTLASGEDGQRRVYTQDEDTASWSFTAGAADATGSAGSALVQISAVLAAVAVVAVVAVVIVRRRKPRPDDGLTTDHLSRNGA